TGWRARRRVLHAGVDRRADHDVQRRPQLTADGGPYGGVRPVLGWRQRHGEWHRQLQRRQLAGQQRRRHRLVAQERQQQRRQQPVLVLGPLGPGGQQVRQL